MEEQRTINELIDTLRVCTDAINTANTILVERVKDPNFDWDKYDAILSGLNRGRYILQKYTVHEDR